MVTPTVPAITNPAMANATLPMKATIAATVISLGRDVDFGRVTAMANSVCAKIERTRIIRDGHDQNETVGDW